ncbi:hypothetical protein AB9K26_12485 [Psychroserpens sp. XS_ASV72]|uniref:hypothetical protein n=1 Tax=Psychroserpens sp. XS_ASV72 TaxID=3241293 RepID=UPI0035154888
MKTQSKSIYLFLSLAIMLLIASCRTEDDLSIDPPADENIEADSAVAQLMSRTAFNDGSYDNIIDYASCVSVELPVTVTVNGIELTITDDSGYQDIEDIIDLFDDDVDSVVITYPITIVLSDYSTVMVNSDSELAALTVNCVGDNIDDDDIECIDFQYPITASAFDENNELILTITINNDNEMYNFIDDLDDYAAVTINFPITVIFADDSTQTINSIQELAMAIEDADDTCDEDDDNDFNDDDCDNCTTDLLSDTLTQCPNWYIDDLERNDDDLEDNYSGYLFSFNADNTVMVSWNNGAQTESGTWSASGSGNNISFDISIPGFDDVNDSWILHEIENDDDDELEVNFRIGDDDELEFKSNCSGNGNIDDSALVNALTNGDWYVTYFFDDTDETADFSDYVFNFASDNTATATDSSGSTNGIWASTSGDTTPLGLILNFGTSIPLDELEDDWDVLEVTNDIIRLKDISGGDGSEDFLTFERTPFEGGNGNDDLVNILSDGLWIVASYIEDSDNQTGNYTGYELDFDSGGTVTASNGSNTNNGTWSVFSNGNEVMLDFGTDMPFQEFNDDDWDVISSSDTEVVLQDVSGGGGGTDTLTLQKL